MPQHPADRPTPREPRATGPSAPLARDVAGALRAGLAEPGRPRLTWYGGDGERVELSGAVLDNWVTKTTNLLVEELDVQPGTTVLLDLPVHWRSLVWALAVWRAGGCVALDGRPGADVVVTADPAGAPAGRDVVVVALPALARAAVVPVPAGALDAASAVMTYGDVLGWVPPADAGAPAVLADGAPVAHGDLLAWAAAAGAALLPGGTPRPRVLLEPGEGDAAAVLAAALTTLAAGGGLVLCSPGQARELAADPSRRERLVSQERLADG